MRTIAVIVAVSACLVGAPARAQLVAMPQAVDFGGLRLGGSTQKTITLTNSGAASLSVSAMAIAGGGSDFSVNPGTTLPLTLQNGAQLAVAVTFSPTGSTQGARSGSLSVTTSAGPVTVTLTGTAGDPKVQVAGGTIVFGTAHVGAGAAAQTISVGNGGYSDLRVIAVALSGPAAGDFALTLPSLPSAVSAGGSLSFMVGFRPMAPMSRVATMTIYSDDPATPTTTLSVAGTGAAYSETVTPTTLDFGMSKVGGGGGPLTATLTNSSTAPLSVTALTITGASGSSFSLVNPPALPATVAASGTLPLVVAFAPPAPIDAAATLVVTLDDPNVPALAVALRGQGTAGAVLVAPLATDLGSVPLGKTSAAQAVAVQNGGTAPLVVTALHFGGPDAGAFNATLKPGFALPSTVAAGTPLPVLLTFTPTRRGPSHGFLMIDTDDPVTPEVQVQVKGFGTEGALMAMPQEIDFGVTSVALGTDPRQVTVANAGDDVLDIAQVALAGPGAASFHIDGATSGIRINPGESSVVAVHFAPSVPTAASTAELVITPAGPASPVSVKLTGTAVSTVVNVAPGDIDFGIVNVGQASDPVAVRVTNVAGAPVDLAPVISTSPAFVVDLSGTQLSLAAGASTTFKVSFAPAAEGDVTGAQVAVPLASAATRPAALVTLHGKGVTPPPASGGGAKGCSIGHGGGSPPIAAVLLACGLMLLRRRRYRS
jgi:hypothetical protein